MVVYSLTNSEDIHYITKQAKFDKISLNVTGLTGAEYGVFTFALENGLPFPRVVASPRNITLSNSQQGLWTYDIFNLAFIIILQRVLQTGHHSSHQL